MGDKRRRSNGKSSFFSIPRGLKTVSGGDGDTELQDRHHRQGQDFGKKISRRPRKATRRRRSRPTEVTDLYKKRNKKSEGEGAERHRPRRRPRAREKNGEAENAVFNTFD